MILAYITILVIGIVILRK